MAVVELSGNRDPRRCGGFAKTTQNERTAITPDANSLSREVGAPSEILEAFYWPIVHGVESLHGVWISRRAILLSEKSEKKERTFYGYRLAVRRFWQAASEKARHG